jgi:hypothetical protein
MAYRSGVLVAGFAASRVPEDARTISSPLIPSALPTSTRTWKPKHMTAAAWPGINSQEAK